MKVIIERNSVCMGDDCMAPHRREYVIDDNASYMDLFEYIKRDRYLPQIHGNNVLKYYSSPERWRDSIYRMHKNDEAALWRDGWKDEVEYCEMVMRSDI